MELTTIELVGLRKICEQVIEETLAQEQKGFESLDDIFPPAEITHRFLLEFYDVRVKDLEMVAGDNEETIKEYLRRKQAEYHKL